MSCNTIITKAVEPIVITNNLSQHDHIKDNFTSEEIDSANFLGSRKMEINHDQQRYPYCIGDSVKIEKILYGILLNLLLYLFYFIVWSPLPVITWFLPFIGHTGIGSSTGVLYDFAGPYTIGVGQLAFGAPTRYLQLDPSKCFLKDWDSGLDEGCKTYSKRMHNICCDNCHSHVAQCLNNMGYGKLTNYEMVRIGCWMFFQSKFVSVGAFVQSYLPFCIIAFIIAFTSGFFS